MSATNSGVHGALLDGASSAYKGGFHLGPVSFIATRTSLDICEADRRPR